MKLKTLWNRVEVVYLLHNEKSKGGTCGIKMSWQLLYDKLLEWILMIS